MSAFDRLKNGPQTFVDSWRGKARVFRFVGECLACERRTFAFDDGENDPRGFLGNATAWMLGPWDDARLEGEHPLCALCANDEPGYRLGIARALEAEARRRQAMRESGTEACVKAVLPSEDER